PYTSVRCDGGLKLGKRARLGCTGHHGWTSLYPAFGSSCNAYFGQAGIWIGPENLAKWASAFGLGERTGIDVPGEQDGNVDGPRTQEAIYRRYNQEWTGWHHGDSANMAIGQGGMLVTPLQMAVAVAATANGGRRIVPRLVRSALLPSGKSWQAPVSASSVLPMTDRTREMLAKSMQGVVESANGTAVSARLPGIEIRGKTGSAESRGKRSPTHAWFVCTAGRRGAQPELAIAVWIDAGGKQLHGGSHAAPVARKLIARYFGIPDQGTLVAGTVAD
ncbi:MAG: penicillin-binding transpeptidase domain-containing protein, partial [Armatimonadaceae bacterium]